MPLRFSEIMRRLVDAGAVLSTFADFGFADARDARAVERTAVFAAVMENELECDVEPVADERARASSMRERKETS
jgi:hypothetical protein